MAKQPSLLKRLEALEQRVEALEQRVESDFEEIEGLGLDQRVESNFQEIEALDDRLQYVEWLADDLSLNLGEKGLRTERPGDVEALCAIAETLNQTTTA